MMRILFLLQGGFYLVAGLWPWAHMRSFIAITGPKTDLWLVQTVGILIAVSGAAFLRAGLLRERNRSLAWLAAGQAVALALVDLLFATRNVISKIYLADAGVELLLFGAWMLHLNAGASLAGKDSIEASSTGS